MNIDYIVPAGVAKMFFCDDKFDVVCRELLSRGWKRDLDPDDRIHKNATLIWTNLVSLEYYTVVKTIIITGTGPVSCNTMTSLTL